VSNHFSATEHDSFFPSRLRHDPSICSFVEAEGPLSEALDRLSPAVAIVGTRSAPPAALRFTRWFARELARLGIVIISGGAYGIDAAAHQGALDVGGRTIAVIGGSLDKLYPEEHAQLFERIRDSGALVAMNPRGTGIKQNAFLRRNALIAALADHVVVTCMGVASGARSTAEHALKMKRTLWVVPGAPWDVQTEGQARTLAYGNGHVVFDPGPIVKALKLDAEVDKSFLVWRETEAERRAGESTRERVERNLDGPDLVGRRTKSLRPPAKRRPAPDRGDRASIPPAPRKTLETCESILPSADERNVVEALQKGPIGIDELVLITGLGVASLRGLLLTWTVEGVVREGPAGLFRLATC
jgi:DNA processing protein